LLIALLSSTAPTAGTTAPATAQFPVTKKVCRDIEVPMSRMKRRVCHKVVVKQPAPEPADSESETTNSSTQAEAESGN
jgi:hypothetical protein